MPSPAPNLREARKIATGSSQTPNTRRSYRSALARYQAWAEARNLIPVPADPDDLADYLFDLSQQGLHPSSVAVARSAIATAHREYGIPASANPAKSPQVTQVMRTLAHNSPPQRQAKALLPQDLQAIRDSAYMPRVHPTGRTESNEQANKRAMLDIALCTVMRDAGLRRSEAAALRWQDVEEWPDGTGRLKIRRSKTNRSGPPETVLVTPDGMEALLELQPPAAQPGDPVFGLSPRQIARRISQAAQQAGLGSGYSGHSGRVGLARAMTRNSAPINAIMKQGRWKSPVTVARYTRDEEAAAALQWLT